MKKSKHFRKDVILARVIFAVFCIVVIVLIWLGGSLLLDKMQGDHTQDTEIQQTESYDVPQIEETEPDTIEETEPAPEIVYYVKTTASIRLRQEPNTNCAVLTGVPVGTKLNMLEEVDGWYKVQYNGHEGYLSGDYVEVIEEIEDER